MFRPALAAALIASPALACDYVHQPEPLGSSSAAFIAVRMASAATYVDLAVARSASGPVASPPTVTFQVVERLKGGSTELFKLYALAPTDPAAAPPPLLHWTDTETGVVYPFPTPWELSVTEPYNGSDCDPGIITPVVGRTYLIFRDAEGRLLGPVRFDLQGEPRRGYAFVDAEDPDSDVWVSFVRRATRK